MLSIPQRIAHVAADAGRVTNRSSSSEQMTLSIIPIKLPLFDVRMKAADSVVAVANLTTPVCAQFRIAWFWG